ncbi:hypothetical protein JXO52_14325 [bacterium]|nr:hypothetical protein [bacterium]
MMKHIRHRGTRLFCLAVLILSAAAAITAEETGRVQTDPESWKLTYRFLPGRTLTYNAEFDQTVTGEFNGETTDIGGTARGLFSLTGTGTGEEGASRITVVIDSLAAEHNGSLAGRSIDAGGAVGKPFSMTMTPRGTISGFSGDDTLRTGMGFNGPGRFLASHFFRYYGGDFFPLLPENPLREGEPYTTEETYVMDVSPVEMHFAVAYTYTVTGKEVIDGIECLKINMHSKGTIDTPAESGPVRLEGDFEAETLFWFDVERGVIVRCSYDQFMEASMSRQDRGVISYSIENRITYTLIQ